MAAETAVQVIFKRAKWWKIASQTEKLERRNYLPKLPAPYQKFYSEWKDHEDDATIIHWVPRKEHWVRNPETGEIKVIQNRAIPVRYPDQVHTGIWAGCGVVEGLVKKGKYKRPVPWFWVPPLHKTVVYSEVLDKYLSVVVTKRALDLIDENYGLDTYLLKNPAYELRSLLAIKIKRKILEALATKDFAHDDLGKQERLYEKYKQYLIPPEELEWYGLTPYEALLKHQREQKEVEVEKIMPLKFQFRKELLQKLQEEAGRPEEDQPPADTSSKVVSWMSKLNPFSKPSHASEPKPVQRT